MDGGIFPRSNTFDDDLDGGLVDRGLGSWLKGHFSVKCAFSTKGGCAPGNSK